jgi:hypothetical protein
VTAVLNAADVALLIMDEVKTCLETALTDRSAPVCSLAVIGGVQAWPDHCDCDSADCGGQAWVRLDRMYPSRQFPVPDTTALGICTTPVAGVIEVGILRCIHTLGSEGALPTDVDLTNDAIAATRDASALLQAIQCCTGITGRSHVLGTYAPRDAGNCAGGLWPVTVQLKRLPGDFA